MKCNYFHPRQSNSYGIFVARSVGPRSWYKKIEIFFFFGEFFLKFQTFSPLKKYILYIKKNQRIFVSGKGRQIGHWGYGRWDVYDQQWRRFRFYVRDADHQSAAIGDFRDARDRRRTGRAGRKSRLEVSFFCSVSKRIWVAGGGQRWSRIACVPVKRWGWLDKV